MILLLLLFILILLILVGRIDPDNHVNPLHLTDPVDAIAPEDPTDPIGID
jgi:hypothetical protein